MGGMVFNVINRLTLYTTIDVHTCPAHPTSCDSLFYADAIAWMFSMNEIWTEKYRPRSLDDVIGQKDVTQRLKGYVEAKNMSHLMFAGSPGTGKCHAVIPLPCTYR